MQAIQRDTYDFSAKPKVVKPRTKYREAADQDDGQDFNQINNLMFDKRVVRGNTYAPVVTSKNNETMKDAARISKPIKRIQVDQQENLQANYEPGTPEAIQGRKHVEQQTDEFVEQLTDKPPEYEKDTQTDFYIDCPVNRLFMPKKNGKDTETQIWDGDLFDFDYEVEPILQVLIGKTLELSRMEVLEEEELKVMKEQQKRYEELRNAELAEMQKLEAKEKRNLEENLRRKEEQRLKLDKNIAAHKKLISRVIAKNFLSSLKPNLIESLTYQGHFRSTLDLKLYEEYLPWLYTEISTQITGLSDVQNNLQTISQNPLNGIAKEHNTSIHEEKEKRRIEREKREKEQREREERIAKKLAAKKLKIELERREKLRQQIVDKMISKGELKPNILATEIADIDGSGLEAGYTGLFGGVIGEVITFILGLRKYGKVNENFSNLQEFGSVPEDYLGLLKEYINEILKEGNLAIGIKASVGAKLAEIDESLNIGNWFLAGPETQEEVQNLLLENIASPVLNLIIQNEQKLNLPEGIVKRLFKQILKQVNSDENLQSKIKFIAQNPSDISAKDAVCFMIPDLSSLPCNPTSERFGQFEEQEEDAAEGEEKKPISPINIVDSDYLPQGTNFNPNGEEIKVLIQHGIAESLLRETVIKSVVAIVKQIENKDFQVLVDSHKVIREVQQQILNFSKEDYPVIEMQTY